MRERHAGVRDVCAGLIADAIKTVAVAKQTIARSRITIAEIHRMMSATRKAIVTNDPAQHESTIRTRSL